MSYTTVTAHSRRGYQVRAHTRRTNGSDATDVLSRDLDRMLERLDQEYVAPVGPVGGDLACSHPDWYPVRRLVLDMPYEDSPIKGHTKSRGGDAESKPRQGFIRARKEWLW